MFHRKIMYRDKKRFVAIHLASKMTNKHVARVHALYMYNVADLKNIYEFLQVHFVNVNEDFTLI